MEALGQALARAGAGHGQVVGLVGEPGVGKSRLVWEFSHSHRTEGWFVLESGSVSYGKATAYRPIIDLLKAYFQIEDRDDGRKIREKVTGKILTLDKRLEPAMPAFLTLLDVVSDDPDWQALDPPQRRHRTLDACKRLVLRESQVQPLLLVFEDLHWIDTETQAFLDTLVESLPPLGSCSSSATAPSTSKAGEIELPTLSFDSTRCRPRAPKSYCRPSWVTIPSCDRCGSS